jgi:molybdate-binding protein
MYQASQGGILEIYENGTTIKEINFKDNNSATYVNKVIRDVDLDI